MPKTVRNFWVEVEVDGKRHKLAGGPKSASGGLTIRLFQRSRGCVREALTVECTAGPAGLQTRAVSQLVMASEQKPILVSTVR